MPTVVIVGAQWGDEGKGKIVDVFSENAQMAVRYAGGPNAGHTLLVGDQKTIVRLIPSGILRPGIDCVLGSGMVVDPTVLVSEIEALEERGRKAAEDLLLAENAHLICSYHILIDGLREENAGKKIGTTKKGIGPAYEDKAARRGIVAGDLRYPARLSEKVARCLEAWEPVATKLGGKLPSVDEVVQPILKAAPRLLPLLCNASLVVDEAYRAKKNIMLEGAQGTLLDVDHGTYPYVTSSSAVAGGACTGGGMGPSRINHVVGIVKAYLTRVGGGPFPTEQENAVGKHMQDVGHEFGSVTGRPRRTGWLDLPALRYAVRVNGLDSIALTKLDVLTELSELKLCTGYRTASGQTAEFPMDELRRGEDIEPIYETFEGWTEELGEAPSYEALPAAAKVYLDAIRKATGVDYCLISVGPRRRETIVIQDPFTA